MVIFKNTNEPPLIGPNRFEEFLKFFGPIIGFLKKSKNPFSFPQKERPASSR